MPAGITQDDSMFSVRKSPWHGLGAVLDQPPATIAEAVAASGLGWRVEREPIAVDRGDVATVNDLWEPRCEEIPATTRPCARTTARSLESLASATGFISSPALSEVGGGSRSDAGCSVRRLLIIAPVGDCRVWWIQLSGASGGRR